MSKISKKSGKKQGSQTSSLAALSRTTQNSQATKKSISTEQIQFDNLASDFQKQTSHFHITIPFEINIKSLTKHLRIKIAENQSLILLHTDEKLGQILLQQKPNDSCYNRFLDCLCLCRKQGWPKKGISQMYEVVSITIKREYVEEKCTIGIKSNFSRQSSSDRHKLFMEQIIYFIKKCLQTFKDLREYPQIKQIQNQSPLWFQINAAKAVFGILAEGNSDKRLKTLFDTSILKLQTTFQQHQKEDSPKSLQIVQKIINESNSLFSSLKNTPGIGQLGLHLDYTLYGVQNMYCYVFMSRIIKIYKRGMEKNCEEFHKNCQYINEKLTNSQYFDYLEVRPKFRLPKTQNPYGLAIMTLRNIQNITNLRDLLQCIQKVFGLIKVACLTEHKGKLEIASMDDILPVMIYVVAKAEIAEFPAYVKLIDDYVRIRGVFQLEERVLTTLYVATQDISRKVPPIKNQ